MGEGMGYDRPAFRAWYSEIQKTYNVRAEIGIDGREYAKYGTTFDNVILVIDKDGPQRSEVLTGKVDSVEALPAMLENIRESRPQLSAEDRGGQPPADQQDGPGDPGEDGMGGKSDAPTPDGADDVRGGKRGGGQRVRSGGASGERGRSPRAGGNRRNGGNSADLDDGRSGGSGGDAGGGADSQSESDVTIEDSSGERVEGELTDSIFENCSPQRLKIPGAKKHPAKLARILDGDSAVLANGWQIKRSTVSGESRIEVVVRAATPDLQRELVGQGVTQERIQWQERFFIPTGQQSQAVFERIVVAKPVIDLINPNAKPDQDADDQGGGALSSRPRPGGYASDSFRAEIDANPSEQVVRDVEFLRQQIEEAARRAGVPARSATIEPVKVSDAARGMAAENGRTLGARARRLRHRRHQRGSSVISGIDLALAGVAAVIALFALYRLRKRRRKVEIEIPPFLRGTVDSGDDASSRFKGNWTEVHPLPKRFEDRDD